MTGITDYKRDGTLVPKPQKYTRTSSGQKRLRQTTICWKLLLQWNDGSKQCIELKLLKESHPVQIAEYEVSRDIDDEPAFRWWVLYNLRSIYLIIDAINSRVKQTPHKYEIEVPKFINEAIAIDSQEQKYLMD